MIRGMTRNEERHAGNCCVSFEMESFMSLYRRAPEYLYKYGIKLLKCIDTQSKYW